ncbi:MAG: DUF1292 domain-containing protein [Lachnospiraceae bacterium]|nr:DUF1292 domain-containing protein [Lachnospiraceae bacterium]
MDKVQFETEDGLTDFFILEQTKLNGNSYILVTDDPFTDDNEVFIMKDISDESDPESIYEFVEDEKELKALALVFKELVDDIDIE